jgi:hypothetical protein
MRRPILIAVILASTAQCALGGDEGVRLSYKLPEATVFRYDASSTLSQKFTMRDVKMTSLVTTDLELKMNVSETVMGRSTLDITYDHARISTRLMTSTDVPPQDTSIELDGVRDLKLRMVIAPDGKVLSSSIAAAHEESKQIMGMLRSTRLFDRLFTEFPTKPIQSGESWKATILDTTLAPQGLGQVVTESRLEMTYAGMRDTLGRKCWVIRMTSKDLHQYGEFTRGEVQMTLDGTGSFSGLSFHDVENGALVTSYSELNSVVTMSFSGQQQTSVPVESRIVLDIHQPMPRKK